MKTLVRKATAADRDALTDLSRRTISASYRHFLGDDAVDQFLGSGAADRYVQENLSDCSVILRDGQVVGFSVSRGNRIDLMMIDCAFYHQGLGTELLRHIEGTLGDGHEELRLESFAANQPANAFYRKHGWREVSRQFDSGSGVDKLTFQKATGPRGHSK